MIVIYYQLKPAIIVDILPAHTYRGATVFVIYIGKKDTDENDDEFMDTIKLCDILGNHYR